MIRLIRLCKKLAWIAAGTSIFVIGAAAIAWMMFPRLVEVSAPFTPIDIDINSLDYYDLGAVDWNRDGYLDLFTTNHSSRQSLLTGNAEGTFTDELTRLGLDQVPSLPGLEDEGAAPDLSQPGFYIYFVKSTLHLTHVSTPDGGTVAGTISVPIQVAIEKNDGFQVTVEQSESGPAVAKVSFETGKNGELSLQVTKSTPITVNLQDGVSLQGIFVGARQVNPTSHSFTLFLKDRHGIAWSDQNDDGVLDAFMSRGALFGRIAEFDGELNDQFFVSAADGRFLDRSTELGFTKHDCPARQVAWVDANNDPAMSYIDNFVGGLGVLEQVKMRGLFQLFDFGMAAVTMDPMARVRTSTIEDMENYDGVLLENMWRVAVRAEWEDRGEIVEEIAETLRYLPLYQPNE